MQAQQSLDRFGGVALGAGFHVAAKQNQRHDDGGGLVIDVDRAGREQSGREGGHHRIGIGGGGAHRHQRVHVGGAAQQRGYAFFEEAQAGAEQYDAGQHELQVPAVLRADGLCNNVVERRHDVRAHFQDEHGQRENRGDGQGTLERLQLGGLAFGHGVCVAGFSRKRPCFVACLGHRLDQGAGGHAARRGDAGAFGGEVDGGVADAWHGLQRFFDASHAGGAGHAGDRQFDRAFGDCVARLLYCLHGGGHVRRAFKRDVGAFGRQVDAGFVDARHGLQGLFDPAHARCAGHAFDGQADRDAVCWDGTHIRSLKTWNLLLMIGTIKIPMMSRSSVCVSKAVRGTEGSGRGNTAYRVK